MRSLSLFLLVLSCSLPAAVVGGGTGGGVTTPTDGQNPVSSKKEPAWVADPTQGGKVKAAVLTWSSGADRDTQRQARKDATDALRTTFKLPPTTKVKDMDTWTDGQGATFILLVAR